jgi:hypothetical protein
VIGDNTPTNAREAAIQGTADILYMAEIAVASLLEGVLNDPAVDPVRYIDFVVAYIKLYDEFAAIFGMAAYTDGGTSASLIARLQDARTQVEFLKSQPTPKAILN